MGQSWSMWRVGRYGGCNHVCNIWWLSVKGCGCGERGIFSSSGLPLTWGVALTTLIIGYTTVWPCDDSDNDNCVFIDVDLYFVCCQNMQYKCLNFFWVLVDIGYGSALGMSWLGYELTGTLCNYSSICLVATRWSQVSNAGEQGKYADNCWSVINNCDCRPCILPHRLSRINLLLLVCVSLTITGQPRNSVFIGRV